MHWGPPSIVRWTRRRSAALLLSTLLLVVASGSSAVAGHARRMAGADAPLSLDWEQDVSPDTASLPYPYNRAFDPIVAAHPRMPDRIAVLYHRFRTGSGSCTTLA